MSMLWNAENKCHMIHRSIAKIGQQLVFPSTDLKVVQQYCNETTAQ